MFVFEKNPTSKLDKFGEVLMHCSIVVHVPWHTSETMSSSVSRQKSLIYVQMWDNFANILRKLGEKSLLKIVCFVLLLARKNLRLKNSYILAKTWLSAPKITRPKKLQHYFPIIINIFLYHSHKKKQKTKNINFHWRTSGT